MASGGGSARVGRAPQGHRPTSASARGAAGAALDRYLWLDSAALAASRVNHQVGLDIAASLLSSQNRCATDLRRLKCDTCQVSKQAAAGAWEPGASNSRATLRRGRRALAAAGDQVARIRRPPDAGWGALARGSIVSNPNGSASGEPDDRQSVHTPPPGPASSAARRPHAQADPCQL